MKVKYVIKDFDTEDLHILYSKDDVIDFFKLYSDKDIKVINSDIINFA